jgi:hypothetical protein
LIAEQLKEIGKASLMKNQLSQTKDYLKKQMAMGYQIQGETCTEEIQGDVFEQLS